MDPHRWVWGMMQWSTLYVLQGNGSTSLVTGYDGWSNWPLVPVSLGLPGGDSGKEPTSNAGDLRDVGSIPGLERALGEENGIPLQYFCRENPTDRGAWWATVHGVAKSRTRLK